MPFATVKVLSQQRREDGLGISLAYNCLMDSGSQASFNASANLLWSETNNSLTVNTALKNAVKSIAPGFGVVLANTDITVI